MTPEQIANKHIDRWQADESLNLRVEITAAINEALALQEKEQAAGLATVKHERDALRKKLEELTK